MSATDKTDLAVEMVKYVRDDVKTLSENVNRVGDKVNTIAAAFMKLERDSVTRKECAEHREKNILKNITKPEIAITEKKTVQSWLKDNIALIIAIITLVTLCGAGFYKFAHFIVAVEQKLTDEKRENKTNVNDIKNAIRQMSKNVNYVPMPMPVNTDTKNKKNK